MTAVDAIVLAGGRASRMGGVDKPAIVIGGRSMLDAALAAVAGCARTVVVGPHRPELDPSILQVREVPPGSGPVAAIEVGLHALHPGPAPLVVVLAADMPFLTDTAIGELLRHENETGADAVFAADTSGRPQYLIGVWRRSALVAALAELDTLVNQPMKALIPDETVTVHLTGVADCDTAEEVRRAQATADGAATQAAATADTPDDAVPSSRPLPLDEARNLVRARLSKLTAYETELRAVRGAALAAPILAAGALPRFDVSAMDGYAVAGDGPWQLRRDIGFAGGQRPVGLLPGEAVRIATGAHVPDGTSAVLRDEFTSLTAENVLHRLPDSPVRDDIRRRGDDHSPGDLIAAEATPVTSGLISAAASVEVTEAMVRGPVRARIVMTGDEIRSDGPLQTGQTRDSIGPILPDVLSWYGIRTVDRVHLRDTPSGFDDVLSTAGEFDLLVIVGATGGGAADQLRGAITRTDAELLVPRLELRPGGSTVVAELSTHTTLLGLPGNPFAAVATLMALAPAIVEGRTGAHPARPYIGPLHNAYSVAGPVARVLPARRAPFGGFLAEPHRSTAHLGGLIDRDGLVIVPAHATDGTPVEFLPLHT
ncbi:NTP transferase domain-containing protein [Nocardia sp. XZ_19_385]|uniref:NTP transferase domain-containing protein n=1 Tax=Nocardia sp. XZ_19_385 TaxID=2769488 RepID=UPI00188FFCAA|nr:NTP transferase domain-containing protein [Nocardia sp. XZ_19_385]